MGDWLHRVFLIILLAIHAAQNIGITYYNVGLFSICGNNNLNQTSFQFEARMYKTILDTILENQRRSFTAYGYLHP